jgi:ribosomal protein L16 Arg81 hydroxylase
MTASPFDFARLLSPLAVEEFFSTYWERQHWHLKRDQPHYYNSLITAVDLENIISDSDVRYPAIRLAKGGGYFPAEVYTRNVKHGDESFLGVPDVKRISDEYRRGATVALPALHRTWKPLGLLCEQLQNEFDHPAHANVYLTPGNAAGFTPHYDVHEVFVLQIAGRKRWSLYAPVIDLPYRTQPFTPQAYSGQAPMATLDLEAGDLLYLPRGVLHSTTTSDSFSAHVTIGITVFTWIDLLREVTQHAVNDRELRKALPVGFASQPSMKPAIQRQLKEALNRVLKSTDVDQLLDSFSDRVKQGQTLRPEPFKAAVSVLTLESLCKPPPAESYGFLEEDQKTMLLFKEVRYQVTRPVVLTIRAMAAGPEFRGLDLDSPLDSESRLVLIRHLVGIGFLTVCKSFGN